MSANKQKASYQKSLSIKRGNNHSNICEDNGQVPIAPYSVFINQAGGHSRIYNIDDEKIAKRCNPQEATFYENIHTEPLLQSLVPKFFEIRHIDYIKDDFQRYFHTPGEFIILENLTAGFIHPCVIDLKLGNVNYDPSRHNVEKIRVRKLKLSSTTSGSLAVRIAAVRVFRNRYGNYLTLHSKFAHHIHTESHLRSYLELTLHDGYRLRTDLFPSIIRQLKSILHALKTQKTFGFLSSSILLVYEGGLDKANKLKGRGVDVKLIDFDHAYIHQQPKVEDLTGITMGITNLINILKKISFCSNRTKSDSQLQKNYLNKIQKIKKTIRGYKSEEDE